MPRKPITRHCRLLGCTHTFTVRPRPDKIHNTRGTRLLCDLCISRLTQIKRPSSHSAAHWMSQMIVRSRSRALDASVPHSIVNTDIMEIWPTDDKCVILGIPMDSSKESTETSVSLDRIIPSLGYVVGNIQLISMKANAMKQDATTEELLTFSHWMIDNLTTTGDSDES